MIEGGTAAAEAEAAAAEEESRTAVMTASTGALAPSHEAASLSGEGKEKARADGAKRSARPATSARPGERADVLAPAAPLALRAGDAGEPAPQVALPGSVDLRAFCNSCPVPDYPARARRRGWQGTVDVELRVGPDGAVEQANVGRSSGYALLDHAAVSVARRSRFWLADGAGLAAGLRGQLRYRFVLEGANSRHQL